MKAMKHLTRTEITAYADDLLPHQELYEIGRHLIECSDCRSHLPPPTIEQFRSAIMTEWEPSTDPVIASRGVSVSTNLHSIWRMRSNWAFGGAALIILFAFSFLIWGEAEKTPDEIVKIIDSEMTPDLKLPIPIPTPDNEVRVSSANSNRSVIPGPLKTNPPKPKTIADRRQNILPKKPNENRVILSETRGKFTKCSDLQLLEMETFTEKENYVFKWKKLPKAAKYHIYISDDEEILVDEYETTGETSFVLKKPLDPAKTYKWKIIVTLENGRTIVGDAQKFNINKFQYNLKKFNRKESLAVRCSANE